MENDVSLLYQDVRPVEWNEFIGNNFAVEYLSKKVDDPKRPHAYLFSGPSGSGKTTAARLFASMLNCNHSDYMEIDAADDRGIDTARELKKAYKMPPLYGSSRFFVIDEAHQLSKDAKDAILKMLEDFHRTSYFILCTTEPESLKTTIRTRTTPVQFESLNETEMKQLILFVLRKTGIKTTPEVMEKIIDSAGGSARYALVLLEMAITSPDLKFGGIGEEHPEVIELCRALVKRANPKTVCGILSGLKNVEPEKIRRAVLGYANVVYLKSQTEIALTILEAFKDPLFNSGHPGLTLYCMQVAMS